MQHDWELQCEICLFWTLSNWTNTVWLKYNIAGKFTKLPEVQQHNQLWVWISEVDIYIAENKQRTFQSQTVDLHQLHRSCINDNIAGLYFCIELLLVYRLNQVCSFSAMSKLSSSHYCSNEPTITLSYLKSSPCPLVPLATVMLLWGCSCSTAGMTSTVGSSVSWQLLTVK